MECLIVEDNAAIRMEYSDVVRSMGLECLEVDSLSEAIYYLKTHDFGIILLDLNLRDGNSLPIADYLHVMGSDATVILITGTGAFPHGEWMKVSPRIDYIMRKPVNLRDLSALIEFSLHKPSNAGAQN